MSRLTYGADVPISSASFAGVISPSIYLNKKEDYELISVGDCIDKLIYGTSESVIQYQFNGKLLSEKEYAAITGEEYIADPPAGYTADEIRNMNIDILLDMDYFLNK